MSTNEFDKEYFILKRDNNSNYPLIKSTKNGKYEFSKVFVDEAEKMEYSLRKPIPLKPQIVDYHPSVRSVVSKRIVDILSVFQLEKVQFIPATIIGKNNKLFEDYFYLHIFNHIDALNKEKSIFKWLETAKAASPIEKLVLDENSLSEIPLDKRLVFRLKENDTFELFHMSVVEKILAIKPEGLKFTKVEDWHI